MFVYNVYSLLLEVVRLLTTSGCLNIKWCVQFGCTMWLTLKLFLFCQCHQLSYWTIFVLSELV